MCALILDSVRINAIVLPNLTKANNALKEAVTYGNKVINDAIESPISSKKNATAFGVRNFTSLLTKKLGKVSNNVNTLSIKLDQKLEKAKLIEKKNKAKTAGIAAAVSAVGAVAGVGVATAGVAGTAAGVVAAAATITATNTNIFSAVGTFFKNTGASIAKHVGNFFSNLWEGVKDVGKWLWDACKKIANKVVSFVKEKIAPLLAAVGKAAIAVGKFFLRTCATIVNLAVSIVEGVVSFVEAIGDVVLLVVGAVCSVFTAFADVVRGICTGEWDWKCTGSVWKKWILPWVGYDWTSKAFSWNSNSFIDKAAFSWAKRENGIGYKIGKGVGYVVGIVVLTAVTAGGGGAAVSAASAASSAGASTLAAAGAGATAFISAGTTAVGTSTLIAGTAKFGAEMQKGYKSLGLKDGEEISTADAWKLVGSSAIKGVVEAGTWYVTYGGAGDALKKSGNVAKHIIGATATNTWGKAAIQAGKEFVNEGANALLKGEFDLNSAITNAVVSAGTSVFYDKSIGKLLKKADGNAMDEYAEEIIKAKNSVADPSRLALLDQLDDEGIKALNEAQKKEIIKHLKEQFDLDYYMKHGAKDNLVHVAQAAGGKKTFGKSVKDNYKEVLKPPVAGIVDAVEAIIGAQ